MNEIAMKEIVEKIDSVFLNILYLKPEERLIAPTVSILSDLKELLNNLFPENPCKDIIYTENTDKLYFGIKVNPAMTAADAMTILATDENIRLLGYQLEFDSKIFDCGLSPEELTATLLFEISSMMDSYEAIDKVRALIDLNLLANDDVINLRNSANYSQLIIFALKDTLYKVSSITFKEDTDEIAANQLIQVLDLVDSAISAQQKIISSSYGIGDSVREPKTIILQWMFMIYKDVKHNAGIIHDTLNDAKQFTASKLLKLEIDKTLQAVSNIQAQTIFENASLIKEYDNKGLSKLLEISLFKSLKKNGLRSIEDAYYEFAVRIKNCSTEEDAMYILRGISTRLSIIEDYIYNSPELSEAERKHYEMVAQKYRELREQVVNKKKIWNKNSYGLFFDYNQLDYLDKNKEEY